MNVAFSTFDIPLNSVNYIWQPFVTDQETNLKSGRIRIDRLVEDVAQLRQKEANLEDELRASFALKLMT